jgi:Tfp pilus assembly protein FimT
MTGTTAVTSRGGVPVRTTVINVHKELFVTALPVASSVWNYERFMNNAETKLNEKELSSRLKGKRETANKTIKPRTVCRDTRIGNGKQWTPILGQILMNVAVNS